MKSKNKTLEERVIRNAKDFISRYGVKGWSMDDLAAAAGITKRTLYKIISSKEQLIRDIVFVNIEESRDALFQILHAGDNFQEYIDLIIYKIPDLLKDSYINRYKDILNEYPDIENEIVSENEKVYQQMNSFFQRGIDKGYFKGDVNSEYINKTLAAVLIFFVKYSASQEEAAEKIREVLRYILFGCINTEGQKPKE